MKEGGRRVPDDLRRKVSKTVLHAAERRRKSLFETLTAKNAEKIAEAMDQEPLLFEEKEGELQELLIDEKIAEHLPQEFYENPTRWIEGRSDINRHYQRQIAGLQKRKAIREFWEHAYDPSRVKYFELGENGEMKIVSKRMDPKDLRELEQAKKAVEAGVSTPKVVGEITDQGNVYVWFEYIPSQNLHALFENTKIYEISQWVRQISRGYTPKELLNIISGLRGEERQNIDRLVREKELFEDMITLIYQLDNAAMGLFIDRKWQSSTKDSGKSQEINRSAIVEDFKHEYRAFVAGRKVTSRLKEVKNLKKFKEVLTEYLSRFGTSEDALLEEVAMHGNRSLLRELSNEKWKVIDEMTDALIRTRFNGVNPLAEKQRLIEEMKTLGIEHKDNEDRNFILAWDFNKDVPALDEHNQPKLMVIDWEQE